MNALGLAVLDQSVGLQERVTFDLVGGGDDTGALDDGLELQLLARTLPSSGYTYVVNAKVGDTNGTGLLLRKLGHGLPGVNNGDVIVNGAIVLSREGEEFGAALEGDRPVNEVELVGQYQAVTRL